MAKDFHETYAEAEIAPPPERSTGFVFAAASAIAAYFFADSLAALSFCAALSFGFLGVSLLWPSLLRPLNIVWFRFSLLLQKIINPIVLGVMFIVAILPFGLVMRIWRDPMRRKKPDATTYWIARESRTPETHSMTNQF